MTKPQSLKKRNEGRATGAELISKELDFMSNFSKSNLDQPPDYITELAKDYYHLIIKELKKISVIADIDQPTITSLAVTYSLIEDCHRIIAKEGQLIEGLHGQKEHPAVPLLMKHLTKATELARQLCITADTRVKLQSIAEDTPGDKLIEEIMRGGS